MKIKIIGSMSLFCLAMSVSNSYANETEKNELTNQAKGKIQAFAKELKSNLRQAVKVGGLEAGIEVCHKQASLIAQRMSTDGWTLSRTSLKTRNDANQPKPWQKEMLLKFQQQLESGTPVQQISFSQLDESSYRLMKAIPTGPLCLSCHGKQLTQSVQSKLNKLYPNDHAVNFSLHDIRGAFVVEKQR